MKKLFLLTILMCVSLVSFSQKQKPRRIKDVTEIVVGDKSVKINDGLVFDCADCLYWTSKMNECVKTFRELEQIKDSLQEDDVQMYIWTYKKCVRDYNFYYNRMNEHHDMHFYFERNTLKSAFCSILQGKMIQIVDEDLMEKCKHYKIVLNK